MQNVEINPETQSLLDAVNKIFPGKVELQFIGKLQNGYVRHDQAQAVQDKDNIMVQISDLSAPDYTASHELLHLLMTLRGFPQIFFAISTGEEQLDQQLMMLGTELYDTVSHIVVVSEQRKHGLITDEIEQMYLKGVQATIQPEPTPVDDKMTLRLLTLTDALVFFGDGNKKVNDQLAKDYPNSFAAAKKLYALITEKPVDSPFTLRRNIVKLFKAFDEQLKAWGLPPINMTEFATVSNVVSERQLRLEVRQMFELYHSDMVDIKSKRRAYVGINRADGQNSFVISAPTKANDNPEYYKAIYSLSVEALFKKLEMPYILR
ncbi:IpaB/EvcA family protein [Lactobacillus sp. LC28-10]|uniref:IpaB/EvcA family protein n=1 Tax=Secundilactobacillus angelensis TaxID=2722706 RepID=A0ABX1KY29_9LACO|nr:IpaB/EvcA family protein [Secundilactobacillus angelensis]MCH5463046.1 IpaB/EvcA family protein [Secundilactobacillus angelensis]NLR18853.1 IpaB/EvcA family protein [Secundilactobacillus angelensis]